MRSQAEPLGSEPGPSVTEQCWAYWDGREQQVGHPRVTLCVCAVPVVGLRRSEDAHHRRTPSCQPLCIAWQLQAT